MPAEAVRGVVILVLIVAFLYASAGADGAPFQCDSSAPVAGFWEVGTSRN